MVLSIVACVLSAASSVSSSWGRWKGALQRVSNIWYRLTRVVLDKIIGPLNSCCCCCCCTCCPERRQSKGWGFTSFCLCVCLSVFPHDISKTDAAERRNVPRWVLKTYSFWDQKVEGQGHESQKNIAGVHGSLHSCECWRLLAVLMLPLLSLYR